MYWLSKSISRRRFRDTHARHRVFHYYLYSDGPKRVSFTRGFHYRVVSAFRRHGDSSFSPTLVERVSKARRGNKIIIQKWLDRVVAVVFAQWGFVAVHYNVGGVLNMVRVPQIERISSSVHNNIIIAISSDSDQYMNINDLLKQLHENV